MTIIPLLRFALYADLMVLFGLPLFGLSGPDRGALAWRRPIAAIATAGLFIAGWAMLAMIAGMADQPIATLDPTLVRSLLDGTALGVAFKVRMAALLLALAAAVLPRVALPVRLALAAGGGGVALGSLAWTGHGAMDEGAAGWLHLAADIAHLLAAGVWLGALAALAALVARDLGDAVHRQRAARALAAFATTGTVAVAVLTLTGAANVWALLLRAGAPLLPLNLYRLLLVAKLVAFAGMLGLAAANRWRFTPALARGDTAIRTSLAVEIALGAVILFLVARLGTLPPVGG